MIPKSCMVILKFFQPLFQPKMQHSEFTPSTTTSAPHSVFTWNFGQSWVLWHEKSKILTQKTFKQPSSSHLNFSSLGLICDLILIKRCLTILLSLLLFYFTKQMIAVAFSGIPQKITRTYMTEQTMMNSLVCLVVYYIRKT